MKRQKKKGWFDGERSFGWWMINKGPECVAIELWIFFYPNESEEETEKCFAK